MQLSDFLYTLPDELIAKFPSEQRTNSRLMAYQNNKIQHLVFKNIIELFQPGDLLILNNTKVLPARFYGYKSTGAKIEFLLERVQDDGQALVYIRANKKIKPGLIINLTEEYSVTVVAKQDILYLIKLNQDILWPTLLDQIGKLPLPPYINREVLEEDSERYQTVYAEHIGAVAAPTAGLHFDQELLEAIRRKGVTIKYITLHVGAGTFQPVRVDNILEHKTHSELYSVEPDVIDSIIASKLNKSRIVAVGTTTLRCLESLAQNCEDIIELKSVKTSGATEIFIYPGFEFKVVDALITNFHLSGSTSLMLVSAFVGIDVIKYCYQQAIEHKYRFYSYGDAMWLSR